MYYAITLLLLLLHFSYESAVGLDIWSSPLSQTISNILLVGITNYVVPN